MQKKIHGNKQGLASAQHYAKVTRIWITGIICFTTVAVISAITLFLIFAEREETPYYAMVSPTPTVSEVSVSLPETAVPQDPMQTQESNPSPDALPYIITIECVSEPRLTYFIAEVELSDISYLRTAFAKDKYGTKITEPVSTMANRNNAIFAVSGDYYGFDSYGVIIRNYDAYRNKPDPREDICAIFGDGTMEVYPPKGITADELVAKNCYQSWCFGPILVKDGVAQTKFNSSVLGANPRTGIGYLGPNHFIFIVVDGRQGNYSQGIKMVDFAKLFEYLGCITAYNLDGGGTSTLYYDGGIMNKPSGGSERYMSDIIYIPRYDTN